ncbi:hypothetical protein [Actinoplanes awajinensis]|uniref:MazF family transcriptional regulator n=1 Tax=Actinoplanes awajinensis subsp. mycoplanecinus TaxID=135947 RepID=A0A0X3V9S8_9ACTN|nr:hypothetical protein [Actinoplanes awajinensis]KUL41324.1 hypothetical protein ADL15_03450 [Actinoplanes awajinensis subsp. mycoplanecinus]
MKRGEVWWTPLDTEWPVVLISDHGDAVQIVAAATAEQKRGFVILTPEQAAGARPVADTGPLVGIEVPIDLSETLHQVGVVRVALPRNGHIFCTWELTVEPGALTERVTTLPAETMRQLDQAIDIGRVRSHGRLGQA